MTLTPAPAHLVTIVADKKLEDFDVTCTCGWLGGSHLFRDLADRAVQEHYAEINAQAQEIREQLSDIMACADAIRRNTNNIYAKSKAAIIIREVIKISALIPSPEKESSDASVKG